MIFEPSTGGTSRTFEASEPSSTLSENKDNPRRTIIHRLLTLEYYCGAWSKRLVVCSILSFAFFETLAFAECWVESFLHPK